VLERESPGRGFRHIVTKREVQEFIDIIPEWDRLSERLMFPAYVRVFGHPSERD
jgi:hypothetical protein